MAFLRVKIVVVASEKERWILRVEDAAKQEHFVYVQQDSLKMFDGERYMPVAVCAVDEGLKRTLIEFLPESTVALNRVWVNSDDVRMDESPQYPKSAYFPILMVKVDLNTTCWQRKVRVVDVEKTAEAAQLECERLTRLYSRYGMFYYWHSSTDEV